MMNDGRDQRLVELFSHDLNALPEADFVADVLRETRRLRRRRIMLRALLAAATSLVAIPMQDMALGLVAVLTLTLVPIDNLLLSQLLMPINTVGGLLSLVILGLRLAHRRLFT